MPLTTKLGRLDQISSIKVSNTQLPITVHVLAMLGHLENLTPILHKCLTEAQMLNLQLLAVRCSFFVIYIFQNVAWLAV